MLVQCVVTDLWADGEGGWSENGASRHSEIIEVSEQDSDFAIARKIKKELGIQGMRTDYWCVSDFGPWRDGCIGAYADIIEQEGE